MLEQNKTNPITEEIIRLLVNESDEKWFFNEEKLKNVRKGRENEFLGASYEFFEIAKAAALIQSIGQQLKV
jgi:hypothetical protein